EVDADEPADHAGGAGRGDRAGGGRAGDVAAGFWPEQADEAAEHRVVAAGDRAARRTVGDRPAADAHEPARDALRTDRDRAGRERVDDGRGVVVGVALT